MNRLHLPPPFDDPELYPGDYVVVHKSDVFVNNDPVCTASNVDEMELSSNTESELESGKFFFLFLSNE